MSIQRLLLTIALALGAAGVALAGGGHADRGKGHAAPAGPSTTLRGEVMDLACYLQHPDKGQGSEHANCARQCIQKGLAAGLKVGGQVYLLMGPGHDPIVDQVAPWAGKQVDAAGTVIERDGLKALVIDSIKPAG